jgi:hypothetical protein
MLIIFPDIKGIVYKEFVLAGQTVNSTEYSDFYTDYMKIHKDFAPNFGDKETACCITTMHHQTRSFSPGKFVIKNNMTSRPPLTLLFCFPD